MKCTDCPLKYIGQIGRTFNIKYKEHVHAIRNNSSNSKFSHHILNTGHTYGTITNTMDIIKTGKKSRHLNILKNITFIESVWTMLHCSILLHCIDLTLVLLLCRLCATSVTIHSLFFFTDTTCFGLTIHLQVYRLLPLRNMLLAVMLFCFSYVFASDYFWLCGLTINFI
jgi:hypothetical protein